MMQLSKIEPWKEPVLLRCGAH